MQAILAFGVMCLCWGANFAVLKLTVTEVPPLQLAGIRFVLSGGILLLWFALSRTPSSVRLADLPQLIWPSLLTITLNYAPLFWSSQHLPSGILGVINPGSVVLAMVGFSLLYRLEQGSWLKLLGVGLGLVGLVLLALQRFEGKNDPLEGVAILFSILGSLAYGWGAILLQLLSRRYSPFELTAWQMFLGGMVLVGLSLLTEPLGREALSRWLKPSVLAGLLYMVFATSILAFSLNNYLLSVWPASRVATSGFVIPVIAMGLGVGLLGERIGALELLACGFLLLSTLVVQGAGRRPLGVR
jgi:drug/metabolite transporter (DMT)-like permease